MPRKKNTARPVPVRPEPWDLADQSPTILSKARRRLGELRQEEIVQNQKLEILRQRLSQISSSIDRRLRDEVSKSINIWETSLASTERIIRELERLIRK